PSARVELDVLRRGKPVHLSLPLSHRASELREISIPLLYSYEKKRDATETSALLGLYQFERTPAAWSLRLLWLFRFSGGDADALEEVGS
ncbi:MAG TPA: hypothetical protein VM509_08330, partial [Planctomycetota bacterium]|nr:hypothetical protein [Planctomycetota bacterium]